MANDTKQPEPKGLTRANGSVLHLTLKKKWFDMIESGEKKEEYRELKEYWSRRLSMVCPPDVIHFRNGYNKGCPEMLVECKGITISYGKPEWGAGDELRYVIKLGNILSQNRPIV